jgi:hypothetical protein
MTRQLELLSQLGIEPLQIPGQERHTFFVRDRFAALVERTRDGALGRIGTAGCMTERGLAMLMWREGKAFFVAKGGAETEATEADVVALRAFTSDLERVLRSC